MNLLDLPDDVLEDIASFLDEKAVTTMRAASRTASISRLVLANRTHAAYFALCQDDADQFHAIMPQYLGRRRGRRTRMNRLAAITLYAQLTTRLVRGNIGFPGRSWALLNAWSHDAGLMTERLMRELMQLALSRGASRALVALLKYRGMNAVQLVGGYYGNANRLSAFFRHPRMIGDPLRAEIALRLSLPLVHGAQPILALANVLLECDPALTLAYLSVLDNDHASLQLVACILERGVCTQGPKFALLGLLKVAFYLSTSSTTETLELARSRLETHVNGDSKLAQRLVDWMARVGARLVQRALLGSLNSSGIGLQLVSTAYVRWAARYLARDTAVHASRVHHAAAQRMLSLPYSPINTELAVAYLQGFPIDLTHTPLTGDCLTCIMCIGDATSEGEPQWFVRSTPASDLQLALARRTADAALHTALAVDRNAAHIAWIRVLQVAYLDICTLFRSWGEIRGSENQLLQGAGVERLELTCGLDGAGIHLSTLMTVQLIHLIQNKSSWFVDAVAAAREAWPETVAEWRVDARVAQHVQASASAFEFQLTDPTVRDILVLLAEAGIPVDVSPRQFLSNITGG